MPLRGFPCLLHCDQFCTVLSLTFAADSRRLNLSLRRRSHLDRDVDERVSPREFPGRKRENYGFFLISSGPFKMCLF